MVESIVGFNFNVDDTDTVPYSSSTVYFFGGVSTSPAACCCCESCERRAARCAARRTTMAWLRMSKRSFSPAAAFPPSSQQRPSTSATASVSVLQSEQFLGKSGSRTIFQLQQARKWATGWRRRRATFL